MCTNQRGEDGELATMGGSFIRGKSRTEEEGGAVGEGECGTKEKGLFKGSY